MRTKKKAVDVLLAKMYICEPAVYWLGDMSLQKAWETCDRGNWMIYVLDYFIKDYDKRSALFLIWGKYLDSELTSKETADLCRKNFTTEIQKYF